MAQRSMTTVITADTIALNAAVFGFAGHSVLTPHQAIQSIWWTDERIEAKVTREFVVSKLRPTERDQLFQPMFQDSGLTEDTYLDWVLGRAKRIFLILVESGVSDQVFGIAEDGWDDSDLPIPLSEVPRLALAYKNDDTLNRRFYQNQFRFLLRPLNFQKHIDYAMTEVVPLEYVHKMAPAAALQKWSRIHLPKMPTLIYVRRKFVLGEKDEIDPELKEQFLDDVQTARSIEHEHIAPVLASWSQKGMGYTMTSFVAEHNLKSFIDFRTPASMQKVKKHERLHILLGWLHCLAHAVAYLHQKRIVHSAICPSNLLVDESNKIAFADLGCLDTFQKDKRFDADELYNYGAPELFDSSGIPASDVPSSSAPPLSTSRKLFSKRRKSVSSNAGSDKSLDTAPALSVDAKGRYVFQSPSGSTETITPILSKSSGQSLRPGSRAQNLSTSPKSSTQLDNRSIASGKVKASSSSIANQGSSSYGVSRESADIYSLACVFLDIITFMLKRKPTDFSKHRSTKTKNANGKGSHVDTSFHNNAQKVESWMQILENDLPSTQDQALFALPPLFRMITDMLDPDPQRRPSATSVQDRVYDALYNYGGLPPLHCSNDDQRPVSTMSFARTSTSGGSSEPRIAAFPPAISLSPPPPPVPPKSTKRSGASVLTSFDYVMPKMDDVPVSMNVSAPLPALPSRGRSLLDLRRWGHQKQESNGSGSDNSSGVLL